MPSRRRFLGTTAAALAATATRSSIAKASPIVDETLQQGGPLPPAIAALRPMTAGVKPITIEERRARIDKATRLMREHKIDALMLTGGTSMSYFTNMRWGLSERMLALILPTKGTPFLVCPKFEEGRAMEQVKLGPLDKGTEVHTWEEDESPSALIADGLKSRGLATGTLGIEETVRFVFSDNVAKALPALRLTSGTPVTAGCRSVKSPAELALMRHASAVTLKAYEAAWKSLADGMTQNQFAELVATAHKRLGYDGDAGVQVGAYSALPHGSMTPQIIRPGTILLIDGGCRVEGYNSDLSRTFVLGKATDRMKKVFDIEHRAQEAAVKTARPGIEAQAVDAAARKVIVDAGFGPDYKYFGHRVGHGIGMDGHEWPYLVKGNTTKLEAGMTFSDEPGIYIPGEFGIRLEDDMIITPNGAELMTPQSPSLEEPFANVRD
jgi:Xaa-Pro dipeptidase